MSIFLPVANLVNLIIENWPVALAVIAVFASLCLGLFKGIKHGVRALIAVLVILVLALGAIAVYTFAQKSLSWEEIEKLIKFCIAWVPTIIFLIIVIASTLTGMRRGLRKSLVLLLHAVITAGICIGAFLFCVTSPAVDKLLLELVNVFMGDGGLQNQLGVSAECQTMREVLLEYVNGYLSEIDEFGVLLVANSAYILTLINMIYRIVFALLFFIIYQLLTFIMYLIYLMFYSERKYKRKRNIRFAMNKSETPYHKHPVGGGCVGLVRGTLSGIISLSFLGSILFIAVGGSGASKLPDDISFGEDYAPVVSIYRSIEDYGEQGIFKVLNAISDPKDTPYYLFAADLVFSGGLDDSEHDVSGNIKFREELAAYMGFAKNTLALLLKYDYDGELAKIIRGESGANEDTMDQVLGICSDPSFKAEFNCLIDNFDSQTYIINFALSFVDAIIANIDDVSFMNSVSADNKELLQVLFRRGYLCETIPDERDRKHSASSEIPQEIPPHITINHLFEKKDAQIVLDIVLTLVADMPEGDDAALKIAQQVIPEIEDLSIFSTRRSSEMDPVLGRLYCYFDNKFLTEEGEDGITYAEIKNENVKWTKEIRALLGVSDGLFTMYDKVQGSENMFDTVISLFDETNEDYAENVKIYEELTEVVSDSALISKALSSKKISKILNDQLKSISEDFYFPEKIVYENKYDGDGNLISHGEAYQLLRGLRLLAGKDNKEIIDSLLDDATEFDDLLTKFADTITKDDPNAPGNTLASYLTESVLLRSVLSSVIMERAGDMLVVPALSCETDSENNVVKLINKPELRQIFDALPEIVDLIRPLASEDVTSEQINDILESDALNALLDNGNKIVEGTVAQVLIDMLADHDKVIISKNLENYEEWLTVGTPGELRKFLNTIRILELDVEELMSGGGLDGEEIFDKIKAMDSEKIEELTDSEVFHYTASKMLDNGDFTLKDFEIIVPDSSCNELTDDKISRIIKKDELTSVFNELKDFGLSSDMDKEKIIKKLVEQKEILNRSNIISASVINFIICQEDICSSLRIPQLYIDAGAKSNLYTYDPTNIWRKELPVMVGAIDEIFGISNMAEDEEFSFNSDTVSEKTNELLKTLNDRSVTKPDSNLTRLDVCYASDILKNNITKELDTALDGVVEVDVIESAKTDGYYSEYELRALSETADIFDLDILKIDNNELSEKVKKEILTLNEPRKDDAAGRSTLDIMYPSAIIRYFVTDEIDKSLNGSDQTDESLIDLAVRDSFKSEKVYPKAEVAALVDALGALKISNMDDVLDESRFTSVSGYRDNIDVLCASGIVTGIITKQIDKSLTPDVIDSNVRKDIKGTRLSYSAEEISALVNALDELDMTEFSDFETVDFSDKINGLKEASVNKNEKDKTKLDVIYRSDIVAGVLTKSVKDTFDDSDGALVYHSAAERSDLAVLKQQEIDSLITLLGAVDLENFDVGTLSLEIVKQQLGSGKGKPKSYLIAANFTATLVKNAALYVPDSVYSDKLIDNGEAINFIDALMALQGKRPVNEWTVEDDMILPDEGNRELILQSEIMCATFSHYIFTNESNNGILFSKASVDLNSSRVTELGKTTEKLPIICNEQLSALFNIIESCTEDSELKIPSFNSIAAIKTLSGEVDNLYNFDVTRYNISDVILGDPVLSLVMPEKYVIKDEECYRFTSDLSTISWSSEKTDVLTREGVTNIINGRL